MAVANSDALFSYKTISNILKEISAFLDIFTRFPPIICLYMPSYFPCNPCITEFGFELSYFGCNAFLIGLLIVELGMRFFLVLLNF